jgi:hypothetical protein
MFNTSNVFLFGSLKNDKTKNGKWIRENSAWKWESPNMEDKLSENPRKEYISYIQKLISRECDLAIFFTRFAYLHRMYAENL